MFSFAIGYIGYFCKFSNLESLATELALSPLGSS